MSIAMKMGLFFMYFVLCSVLCTGKETNMFRVEKESLKDLDTIGMGDFNATSMTGIGSLSTIKGLNGDYNILLSAANGVLQSVNLNDQVTADQLALSEAHTKFEESRSQLDQSDHNRKYHSKRIFPNDASKEGTLLQLSCSRHKYFIIGGKRYQIKSWKFEDFLGHRNMRKIQLDCIHLQKLNSIVPFMTVPFEDAYNDQIIRFDCRKDVYLVHSGAKTKLTAMAQFAALNKTSDDIVILRCAENEIFNILIPTVLPANSSGTHLLLIGSSVDRMLIHDLCNHYHLNVFDWGNESLVEHHKSFYNPPSYCANDHFLVAAVQIFGSSAVGPYYHGLSNTANSAFVDTKVRLQLILFLYRRDFGKYPDRLIVSSGLWDCSSVESQSEAMPHAAIQVSNIISKFQQEINNRIDEIMAIVGNHTDVGLRTDIWSSQRVQSTYWKYLALPDGTPDMMHQHNAMIRTVALLQRNLTLYDYDHDVWSSALPANYTDAERSNIFKDHIHPRPHHQVAAGLKILGYRYSPFVRFQGQDEQDHIRSARGDGIMNGPTHSPTELFLRSPPAIFRRFLDCLTASANNTSVSIVTRLGGVSLIQGRQGECVFYFHPVPMSRYSGISGRFLGALMLSVKRDVLRVGEAIMARIPYGGEIPAVFEERVVYRRRYRNVQSEGDVSTSPAGREELWLVLDNSRWQLRQEDAIVLNASTVDLSLPVDWLFFQLLVIRPLSELPPFRAMVEGALLRPRKSKQIFYISQGKRHLVPNMNFLQDRNKSIEDVIVVDNGMIGLVDAYVSPKSSPV